MTEAMCPVPASLAIGGKVMELVNVVAIDYFHLEGRRHTGALLQNFDVEYIDTLRFYGMNQVRLLVSLHRFFVLLTICDMAAPNRQGKAFPLLHNRHPAHCRKMLPLQTLREHPAAVATLGFFPVREH